MLRRQRVLIILVILVAVGAGAAWSLLIKSPEYIASSSLSFTDEAADLEILGTQFVPNQQPEKLASARVDTVYSARVLKQVLRRLEERGVKISKDELRSSITATVDPESNLVVVDATSESPEIAQIIANTTAQVTANVENRTARREFASTADLLRERLRAQTRADEDGQPAAGARYSFYEDQLARLDGLSEIAQPASVAQTAALPSSPVSPQPVRDIALALFLGVLLGMGAAIAREALDRRVHSSDEIQRLLDLPVVGYVREGVMGESIAMNGAGPWDERDADSFRILRANLAFMDVDRPPRSLLVTSGLPEEGKSTVAAALARASAVAGTRTLLLECDLRRPVFAKRLGVQPEPGLTDHLSRQLDLDEVTQIVEVAATDEGAPGMTTATGTAQLICITSGTRSPQPAEALGSERFQQTLKRLEEEYELVVIDTTPLLSVADARELVPLVDAVLLCTRVSRTTRDQMAAAKDALERFPKRPTAVVVTGMRRQDEPDYGYYSYAY